MTREPSSDPKERHLRLRRALHPHPERVRDESFLTSGFFDPRDQVQVRYEMLRRHRVDEEPISRVTRRFGVSRPTFYQVAAQYEREGLAGLVPSKRGPKGPHKCTGEILEFVRERRAQAPDLPWEDLLQEVTVRFGVTLHRRTVERGLARQAKKGRSKTGRGNPRVPGME